MADRRGAGGRPPDRRLGVMFLGAGASKAAGLPLTEELLRHIWPREYETGSDLWSSMKGPRQWKSDLEGAVKVLYPDGGSDGFRPLVSEFFTLLEVMDRVHAGRERLPLDAGELLRALRAEIALGLTGAVNSRRRRRPTDLPHYRWLTAVQGRPSVIVTSNWDTLVEQTALRAGLDVLLSWPRKQNGDRRAELPSKTVVVLKLHGSIDWGRNDDPCVLQATREWEYDRVDAVVDRSTRRQHSRDGSERILRFKTYDHPMASERTRSGFEEPLMATMAAGKDTYISDLTEMWDDAYWVLSRADRLDIVGYSFPPDDLELRTLLRVTTRQPGQAGLADGVELSVCNPSPDTHDRARSFLGMDLTSSFEGAGSWRMRRRRASNPGVKHS